MTTENSSRTLELTDRMFDGFVVDLLRMKQAVLEGEVK